MFFRVEYTLRGLGLVEGEQLEFSEPGPPPVSLTIRRPAKGEDTKLKPEQCVAVVRTEAPVTEKVRPHFDVFEPVHDAVAQLGSRVGSGLHDYLVRAVGVLRWRRGAAGHPNPIVNTRLLHWSEDGENWKGVPATLGMHLEIRPPHRKLGDELMTEVRDLVTKGASEPVGHELLLEAWEQQRNLPRSSLLIGISAAEVGAKEFIAKLVPKAEWLAFNAPTPPLTQILTDYLPLLPVKLTVEGVPPFIPKEIVDEIKKGVLLRNKTAHAGKDVPSDTLNDLLSAVHDLLYLFDFYAGHGWALECVRHETRELMKAEANKKSKK